MKVVVLGGTGMLGSMVVRVLSGTEGVDLYAGFRSPYKKRPVPMAGWFYSRAERPLTPSLELDLGPGDWIVNAIGAIPQRSPSQLDMIEANSALPHRLARRLERGVKIVHVTTDCVFSGKDGSYNEDSPHDATHAYGKSKSLGEVDRAGFLNLRCSIVGPEVEGSKSLMGWVRSHRPGESIPGFSNHLWNGVTTLDLARVIRGLIAHGELPDRGTQHLVPAHPVSKRALVQAIVDSYKLDCTVENVEHGDSVKDMTLATLYPDVNEWLWSLGGYERPPGIEGMIKELAAFEVAHESAAGTTG